MPVWEMIPCPFARTVATWFRWEKISNGPFGKNWLKMLSYQCIKSHSDTNINLIQEYMVPILEYYTQVIQHILWATICSYPCCTYIQSKVIFSPKCHIWRPDTIKFLTRIWSKWPQSIFSRLIRIYSKCRMLVMTSH